MSKKPFEANPTLRRALRHLFRDHYFYRLDGHEPVRSTWDKIFHERVETIGRTGKDPWRVAFTEVDKHRSVSTVFLGIDHRFGAYGKPLLFETAIFGPKSSVAIVDRSSTWEEAEAAHEAAVAELRGRFKVVK